MMHATSGTQQITRASNHSARISGSRAAPAAVNGEHHVAVRLRSVVGGYLHLQDCAPPLLIKEQRGLVGGGEGRRRTRRRGLRLDHLRRAGVAESEMRRAPRALPAVAAARLTAAATSAQPALMQNPAQFRAITEKAYLCDLLMLVA
jgi:hypothetical protein